MTLWQRLQVASRIMRSRQAVHQAADSSRRNADWRARRVSADAEIIPDTPILLARARQQVRDNAMAKAAVRAYVRNVAGRGIAPVPTISAGEQELEKLNEQIEKRFWKWASDRRACDAEQRRTFWQMQRLAVAERFTVGGFMMVWSHVAGSSMKLQSFEYEQLDTTLQNYEGNEVRGGIEVGMYGQPLAYHLWLKPPNDLYFRHTYKSERIPADRVFHYFDPTRVLQTLGKTELAAVMQDVRDDERWKNASLWTRIMQSCIGLIRKKAQGVNLPGGMGLKKKSDTEDVNEDGDAFADFAPGMYYDAPPGGDLVPFAPTQNAGDFEAFSMSMARRIGAGTGLSYGQLTRDFTRGTYSGQRQEMLEDWKEFDPEQDNLIDSLILPIYETWLRCEVINGSIPIPIVAGRVPDAFLEAEYPLNAKPWIDPKAEAEGINGLIENGVATRTEFTSSRGGRFRRNIRTIANEQQLAQAAGVTLRGMSPTPGAAGAATTNVPPAAIERRMTLAVDPAVGPSSNVNTEVKAEGALNGAQITAVLDVLGRLGRKEVVENVALELIVAVGIPRERAQQIVRDQASAVVSLPEVPVIQP